MLWKSGNRSIRLKHYQYRLATVYGDYEQAKEDLHQTTELIASFNARLSAGSPLRAQLGVVQEKMPNKGDYDMNSVSMNHLETIPVLEELQQSLDQGEIDESSLIQLHRYVIDLGRYARVCVYACVI
jgi:hypothetical protein